MRLVFVNRFYWPEEPATGQLLGDLAEALAAAGHHVTVITSRPADGALPAAEIRAGVHIKRVAATRWARGGLGGKAIDYILFYAAAVMTLLMRVPRGAIVIALTDPPLLGVGAWLVARARGAAIVHWVQDVYPEIAIALSGHRWLGMLRPLRNLAWRRADACVAVGADMAALLEHAGVARARLHVIHNRAPAGVKPWDEVAPSPLRAEWDLGDRFVVTYSGNLGRVHDLEPILDAAACLRDYPGVAFLFIGGGPQRRRLEKAARERELHNVQFRPAQPRDRLNETLAVADLHLVTLRAGCEQLVFPSKLQGIVAAGHPILFVGPTDSEPARIVREHRLGFAFAREDTESLAATVRRLAEHPDERAGLVANVRTFAGRDSGEAWREKWHHVLAGVERGGGRCGAHVERVTP